MGVAISKPKKRALVVLANEKNRARKSTYQLPVDLAESGEQIHHQRVTLVQNDSEQTNITEDTLSSDIHVLKVLKTEDRDNVLAILNGDMTKLTHHKARIVRIFTSSTFTDTFVERNYLMQFVYPKLKKYCQEHGFEFQVVDMRWGVRNEAMDDHQVLDLCIKEIENCQKVSTGPTFVSLLNEKYGYRPIPTEINETEFNLLTAKISDSKDIDFLHSWYTLDENHVPRVFVLQPISSRIPDYVNTADETSRQRGINEWDRVRGSLAKILRSAAEQVLLVNDKRKYFASVSELEIEQGILQTGCDKDGCFWFKRNIVNLGEIKGDEADQYKDIHEDEKKESAIFLANIQNRMLNEMNPESVKQYHINWDNNGGVNPENREHSSYLSGLCDDVCELLVKRIDEAIEERLKKEVNLQVHEEVCRHLEFAKSRCEYFQGRGEELNAIHNYLKGSSSHPLVVHGESGSGKTSILSMTLDCCKNWFNSDITVIARYLGTTPDSSLLRRLLYSLCQQIAILLGQDYEAAHRKELKTLKDDFTNFLTTCKSRFSEENPLVIILDSLDQLSPEDGAFQLTWLPLALPSWVKMVISTLSQDRHQCLNKVQSILPAKCFVTISRLPLHDAVCVIDRWLLKNQRTLTDQQRQLLLAAFEKCSLPIFLKVSFEEALRWKSYTLPDEVKLENTVRGAINSLFERIERQHGKVFVQHALSYITVAKNGLTESELEDILSCDEEVLEDVYQYWVPPVRRIPPLLWLRLKYDLSSYLADRGADESMVVTWYHRQFVETANQRFLANEEERVQRHSAIADYFMGVWANSNKKPHKSKDGSIQFSDRLLAAQPVTFKPNHNCKHDAQPFNLRKLSELPYHLVMSRDLHALKKECLCNYEFLLAQLRARGLSEIMDNFDLALTRWPKDRDLITVYETLKLSTNALSLWPGQLASQLMSRIQRELIDGSECLQMLRDMTRKPSLPAFVPQMCCLTSPGGPLLQSLSGSSEKPASLRLSGDGRILVSIGEENEILVWDARAGRVIRNIQCAGGGTTFSCLSKSGNTLIISRMGMIKAWSPTTGQPLIKLHGYDEAAPISICEVNLKEAVLAYFRNSSNIIDLRTGEIVLQYATKLTSKQLERPSKNMVTSWKNKCIVAHKDLLSSSPHLMTIESFDTNIKYSHNIFKIRTASDIMSLEIIVQNMLLVTYTGMEEDLNKNRRPSARPSVASSWQKMTLELWDMKTMKPTRMLTSSQELVRCSCVSPDRGKIIMLCNSSFIEDACEFKASIKIYSVIEKDYIKLPLSYPSAVGAICGIGLNCIITSSMDKIIRVWDMDRNEETGTRLRDIYGHTSSNELNGGLNTQNGHCSGEKLKILVHSNDEDFGNTDENTEEVNGTGNRQAISNGKDVGEDVEVKEGTKTSNGYTETNKSSNKLGNISDSHSVQTVEETYSPTELSNKVNINNDEDERSSQDKTNKHKIPVEDDTTIEMRSFNSSRVSSNRRSSSISTLPTGKNYLKLNFNDLSLAVDPKLQENDHEVESLQLESCWGNILIFYARKFSESVHTAVVWNLDSDLKMRIAGLENPEACVTGDDGSLIVVVTSTFLSVYRSGNGDLVRSLGVDVDESSSDRLVAFPGNKVLVVESGRQSAQVYSIPQMENLHCIRVGPKEMIMRIITSDDGNYFVVCIRRSITNKSRNLYSAAEIWNSSDFCKLHTFEYGELISEFSDTRLFNNGSILTDLAFDKKENRYRLIIWNSQTATTTYITPTDYNISLFKPSLDCKTLIIGTWNGDLLSYEIGQPTIKYLARSHSGPVHEILLSQSGDRALTIAGTFNSRDRSIRLWNTQTGKMITEYTPDVKISSLIATSDFRYFVFEIQGQLVKFELLHDS